jgi:4a-hydroxytetrahydrobiopterin dehydratase
MWQEKDGYLYKKFELDSFEQAMDFINHIAKIAKEMNHHPKIINDYSVVELSLTTHSASNKITDKDREFAEKVDKISL